MSQRRNVVLSATRGKRAPCGPPVQSYTSGTISSKRTWKASQKTLLDFELFYPPRVATSEHPTNRARLLIKFSTCLLFLSTFPCRRVSAATRNNLPHDTRQPPYRIAVKSPAVVVSLTMFPSTSDDVDENVDDKRSQSIISSWSRVHTHARRTYIQTHTHSQRFLLLRHLFTQDATDRRRRRNEAERFFPRRTHHRVNGDNQSALLLARGNQARGFPVNCQSKLVLRTARESTLIKERVVISRKRCMEMGGDSYIIMGRR